MTAINSLFFLTIFSLSVFCCNVGSGSAKTCGSHTMIVFDASHYQKTWDNVEKLFNFIENNLMSAYDLRQENVDFSFGYYGMSNPLVTWSPVNTIYGKKNIQYICSSLNEINIGLPTNNLGKLTLTQAMFSIANLSSDSRESSPYDNVILFTATDDQLDVDNAANVRDRLSADVTVINMNHVDFSKWKNTRVLCNSLPFPQQFELQIINQSCRRSKGDAYCGAPSTKAPSTTTTTTTTPIPITFIPTILPNTSQCPCEMDKIWNDVYLLLDGSNALSAKRFQEMLSFMMSGLGVLNIGQNPEFQTRVGIIEYGEGATLLADLNKFKNSEQFMDLQIDPLNEEHTNIKASIDMARDNFQNYNEHRPSSRKVIVIGASTFREGNYDMPLQSALTFKANGGIIVVVVYGDLHGETSAILQQIASPGYYVDAQFENPNPMHLVELQCRANCFCPNGYYSVANTTTDEPSDGCFFTSEIESNQRLGKRICAAENGGVLAIPKDNTQMAFIVSQFSSKVSVWIGLENVNNLWTWADGTPFTGEIVPGSGNCATLTRSTGFRTVITQVDCYQNAFPYACQTIPCSTTNYCDAD